MKVKKINMKFQLKNTKVSEEAYEEAMNHALSKKNNRYSKW